MLPKEQIKKTMALQLNNGKCFDCHADKPEWASVNNGIALCMQCAGIHRGLGVHISFVKSMMMDSWNEKELRMI